MIAQPTHMDRMLDMLGQLQEQQQRAANVARSYQDLALGPQQSAAELAFKNAQTQGLQTQNRYLPDELSARQQDRSIEHAGQIAKFLPYLPPDQAHILAGSAVPDLLQHLGIQPDPNAALAATGAKYGMSAQDVLNARNAILNHSKGQSNASASPTSAPTL